MAEVSIPDVFQVLTLSDTEYFVDCGQPHLVVFCPEPVANINVFTEGMRLSEKWNQYNKGEDVPLVVDFVYKDEQKLKTRAFARAGCIELLACGTGTVAVALCNVVHSKRNGLGYLKEETGKRQKQSIDWPTGQLCLEFCMKGNSFTNLKLQGSAISVFSGVYTYFL